MKEQVAFVTGAGSGIGREIAKRLGNEGAKIIVADIDMEKAEETVSILENMALH